MNHFIRNILPVVAFTLFTNAAMAQNQLDLGSLGPQDMVLNMSLTEQQMIDQDTLNADLQFVAQGRDQKQLQNDVNKTMNEATALVRKNPALKFNTTFYNVNIVPTNRPSSTDIRNPVFRAQQGIHVETTDAAALLEILADLQELGLAMNGLYYSLSAETHERVSGELLNTALTKLQTRAEEAAETLGKKQARLVEVTMDASPMNMGFRRFRAEAISMADRDFSAPVADPGETQVSVSVSARAVLSP